MKKKILLLLFVAVALGSYFFGLGACDKQDVGVPCEVEGTSEAVTFNFQAHECRSRVCVRVGQGENAIGRCTQTCQSDGDCPGPNEIGNCTKGFKCVVGHALAQPGSYSCCKICICEDQINSDILENEQTCAQELKYEPVCPSL